MVNNSTNINNTKNYLLMNFKKETTRYAIENPGPGFLTSTKMW